jgi:DNA mismatch repair ATPase MutS
MSQAEKRNDNIEETKRKIEKFSDRYKELRKEYSNLILLFHNEETYCTLDNDAILISYLLSIDLHIDGIRRFSDFPKEFLNEHITTLLNMNQEVLIVTKSNL